MGHRNDTCFCLFSGVFLLILGLLKYRLPSSVDLFSLFLLDMKFWYVFCYF